MRSTKGFHKGWYIVLGLLAIAVLTSGCQEQTTDVNMTPTATSLTTPTPTPQPTPTLGQCNSRILPGHLLVYRARDIHELTCAPTGTVKDQVIPTAPESSDITISPDGQSLRYHIFHVDVTTSNSSSMKIVSQDLQTGTQNTYQIPGHPDNSCLSWSPSGTQVSYTEHHGLIVEDLTTGAHRVLVQEPSAMYTGGEVFGSIDCGTWVSDDLLLFHRFTGPFPVQITDDVVPINTTTLALLRDGSLVDTAGASLQVIALSQDGEYALLADTKNVSYSWAKDSSWKLAKVSDFTSFEAARPISCSGIHCALLGFVPNSDEVFGFQYDPSAFCCGKEYKGLVFVNPQSLVVQLGPTELPANATGDVGSLEVIKWGGIPDDAIIVYELSDQRGYYAVTSLRSGEVDWLVDLNEGQGLRGSFLGWVP